MSRYELSCLSMCCPAEQCNRRASGWSEVLPYYRDRVPEGDRNKKMASRASLFNVILGSSSASRRGILAEMGYKFTIMSADIDEKEIRREKPEELVMALAEAKADAIITRLPSNGFKEDHTEPTLLITADQADAIISRIKITDYREKDAVPTLLLTSDTVVVHEGIIKEKPTNKEEARQFLKGYSGDHVSTVGSVVVTNLKTGRRYGGFDKAEVYFHDIPDEIIESLIDEGVVFRAAGGLLLEHPLTLPFVEAVVGASDSVMGLPKALTEKLIQEALSAES